MVPVWRDIMSGMVRYMPLRSYSTDHELTVLRDSLLLEHKMRRPSTPRAMLRVTIPSSIKPRSRVRIICRPGQMGTQSPYAPTGSTLNKRVPLPLLHTAVTIQQTSIKLVAAQRIRPRILNRREKEARCRSSLYSRWPSPTSSLHQYFTNWVDRHNKSSWLSSVPIATRRSGTQQL